MVNRIPEVRYSKRVLVALFILFVLGLCLATTVSIVRSLRAQGSSDAEAASGPPKAPGATALAELKTLYQELRARAETHGRSSLERPIDTKHWEDWSVAWRARFDRVGQRYGLDSQGDRVGALARSVQRAYRGTLALLTAYDQAVKQLAFARMSALDSVKKDLEEATRALSLPTP